MTEIAGREIYEQIDMEADGFSFILSAIRTTAINKETGARSCAAELEVTQKSSGKAKTFPITYTVENTDSGDVYVTVDRLYF